MDVEELLHAGEKEREEKQKREAATPEGPEVGEGRREKDGLWNLRLWWSPSLSAGVGRKGGEDFGVVGSISTREDSRRGQPSGYRMASEFVSHPKNSSLAER